MARKAKHFERTDSDVKEELRRRLSPNITVADLAAYIADLLRSLGKRPGSPDKVAQNLATALFPKFLKPKRDLEQLIEYKPHELDNLLWQIFNDECRRIIEHNPDLFRLRRSRTKIANEDERQRRLKAAKNRYERTRRAPQAEMGLIEREFADGPSFLLNPFANSDPWGPCLDDIFRGDSVKMSDGLYSLESLFGLSRKSLSAAKPAIRQGREFFYDYRAVLACMQALLRRNGRKSVWLSDPPCRLKVLRGVVSRAKDIAITKVEAAFRTILEPLIRESYAETTDSRD